MRNCVVVTRHCTVSGSSPSHLGLAGLAVSAPCILCNHPRMSSYGQPTGQSEQFGFRQLRVVSGGRLRQCRLRNTVTPRFHCAVYPLRAVTSAVAALVGHRHEFKILVDGSIVEGRRARLRCANWDRPTYFGYRSCIAVKRRRAFEGKEVRNGPPYFQIFVLKSRLLAFYPLSSGPLNNMRLVKSQSKIIYPGPKFVSWPLQLGCLRRHLHWKCRVFV